MSPPNRWRSRTLNAVALATILYLGLASGIAAASTYAQGTVPTDSGGDLPTWPFALGTVLVVAAGALWAIRRRP